MNKKRVVKPPNPLFDNPQAPTVAAKDGAKDFINMILMKKNLTFHYSKQQTRK